MYKRLTATALALIVHLGVIGLYPAPVAAQGTGRITGVVTDNEKVPVSGAQVTVVGSRREALTGLDGRYIISGVPAGTYEIRVQSLGQTPKIVPGVSVQAGQEVTVDVALDRAAGAGISRWSKPNAKLPISNARL